MNAQAEPKTSLAATLWEAVRTSVNEVFAHKLRSTLTLVGIVLGTTSLVVMVSVIGGAAESIKAGFADLGFDGVMFAVPSRPEDRIERKKQGYSRGLRSSDVAVINHGKELIESAAPLAATRDRVRINGHEKQWRRVNRPIVAAERDSVGAAKLTATDLMQDLARLFLSKSI